MHARIAYAGLLTSLDTMSSNANMWEELSCRRTDCSSRWSSSRYWRFFNHEFLLPFREDKCSNCKRGHSFITDTVH